MRGHSVGMGVDNEAKLLRVKNLGSKQSPWSIRPNPGRFGPNPVRSGRFGPGRFGPNSGVSRFGPVGAGRFGPISKVVVSARL